MATEKNGALTTVSWNGITLYLLGVTPPAFTRDDPVDNTHTSSGAIREFVASPRYTVGELTVRAKYDAGVYDSLQTLTGSVAGVVTTATFTITLDSGATESYDDVYCQSVTCDEVTEGAAPVMTVVFNQQTIA